MSTLKVQDLTAEQADLAREVVDLSRAFLFSGWSDQWPSDLLRLVERRKTGDAFASELNDTRLEALDSFITRTEGIDGWWFGAVVEVAAELEQLESFLRTGVQDEGDASDGEVLTNGEYPVWTTHAEALERL
jgi:hypothetical protein